MQKKISIFICTIGGTGFFPKAPGTAGSFMAALFLYFFHLSVPALLITAGILFLLGLWSIPTAEKQYGSDAGLIVIDEVIGQWLALLAVPRTISWFLAGFILFRIFDIAKPLGINALQKLPGAYGVLADDILAGLYVLILLQAALLVV